VLKGRPKIDISSLMTRVPLMELSEYVFQLQSIKNLFLLCDWLAVRSAVNFSAQNESFQQSF